MIFRTEFTDCNINEWRNLITFYKTSEDETIYLTWFRQWNLSFPVSRLLYCVSFRNLPGLFYGFRIVRWRPQLGPVRSSSHPVSFGSFVCPGDTLRVDRPMSPVKHETYSRKTILPCHRHFRSGVEECLYTRDFDGHTGVPQCEKRTIKGLKHTDPTTRTCLPIGKYKKVDLSLSLFCKIKLNVCPCRIWRPSRPDFLRCLF